MGAAPTISYVAGKGWKLLFTWAMGSKFNTKFRLIGPWKWEAGAEQIMRGELYGVVRRSGGYICKRDKATRNACIVLTALDRPHDLYNHPIHSLWHHKHGAVRVVRTLGPAGAGLGDAGPPATSKAWVAT